MWRLLVVLAACGSPARVNVEVNGDVAFTVTRHDELLSVAGPVADFPARTELDHAPDELFVVALTHAQLAESFPGFLGAVALDVGPPPDSPESKSDGTRIRVRGPLHPDAEILRVDPLDPPVAAPELRMELTLSAEIDPEFCRPNLKLPVRFGPNLSSPFGRPALAVPGLAIVTGPDRIDVVSEGPTQLSVGPPEPAIVFFDSVLDRSLGVIFAVGCRRHLSDPHDCAPERPGYLFRIPLAGDQLGPVETATMTTNGLERIALGPDGHTLLLAGIGSSTYLFDTRSEELVPLPALPIGDVDQVLEVEATPSLEVPFVATSRNYALFFSETKREFTAYTLGLSNLRAYGLAVISRTDRSIEVWFAGTSGYMARSVDFGAPATVTPSYPPRLAPCLTADGKNSLADIVGLVAGDGYVFPLLERCSALVAVRAQDLCAAIFETGERARFEAAEYYEAGVWSATDGLYVKANELEVLRPR
ncbi:MAG: hypothetical protein HY791_32105 [Deltaproteobacteria bacterium]|nr:hypothetical protein [Deltaproteobacteria bacterium]